MRMSFDNMIRERPNSMKTEDLRALHAPLKERYKEHPDAALITSRHRGGWATA